MLEALFGPEMPLAARFFLAFVVVLALIGGIAFVLRKFGGDRLGLPTMRGRQARLAVIEAATVDSRRRLILIRRDNVEHLLLVGGPTDVVVEMNIGRASPSLAAPAPMRDVAASRAPIDADNPPRAAASETGLWDAEPETPVRAPVAPPRAAPEPPMRSPRPVASEPAWRDEIAEPEIAPPVAPSPTEPTLPGLDRLWPALGGGNGARPHPERPAASVERIERPAPGGDNPLRTAVERPIVPAEKIERTAPVAENNGRRQPMRPGAFIEPGTDQNLAEMAQRLEAALRRPMPAPIESRPQRPPQGSASAVEAKIVPVQPRSGDNPIRMTPGPAPDPRPSVQPQLAAAPKPLQAVEPPPPAPAQGEPKQSEAERNAAKANADFRSLEMEMASLLGRPLDKK